MNVAHLKLLGCLLFLVPVHWIVSAAQAAEIVCVEPRDVAQDGECLSIFLKGAIEKGDYERFMTVYRLHHRTVEKLYLQSPGGDADEAMKLGRVLRNHLVAADAPTGDGGGDGLTQMLGFGRAGELCEGSACICASACALIWIGSVDRWGSAGFHRPKLTNPQFAKLPFREAIAAYNGALQRVVRYLEEMEAPRALVDNMVATGTEDVHWVSNANYVQLQHPVSFIEWVNVRCPAPRPDYLAARARCQEDLVRTERKTLPRP